MRGIGHNSRERRLGRSIADRRRGLGLCRRRSRRGHSSLLRSDDLDAEHPGSALDIATSKRVRCFVKHLEAVEGIDPLEDARGFLACRRLLSVAQKRRCGPLLVESLTEGFLGQFDWLLGRQTTGKSGTAAEESLQGKNSRSNFFTGFDQARNPLVGLDGFFQRLALQQSRELGLVIGLVVLSDGFRGQLQTGAASLNCSGLGQSSEGALADVRESVLRESVNEFGTAKRDNIAESFWAGFPRSSVLRERRDLLVESIGFLLGERRTLVLLRLLEGFVAEVFIGEVVRGQCRGTERACILTNLTANGCAGNRAGSNASARSRSARDSPTNRRTYRRADGSAERTTGDGRAHTNTRECKTPSGSADGVANIGLLVGLDALQFIEVGISLQHRPLVVLGALVGSDAALLELVVGSLESWWESTNRVPKRRSRVSQRHKRQVALGFLLNFGLRLLECVVLNIFVHVLRHWIAEVGLLESVRRRLKNQLFFVGAESSKLVLCPTVKNSNFFFGRKGGEPRTALDVRPANLCHKPHFGLKRHPRQDY